MPPKLPQPGLTLHGIVGPRTSAWGAGPVFQFETTPRCIPARVPLGIRCRLCCDFPLCSVWLSFPVAGVTVTAFPDKLPALKPPPQRLSLENGTQHSGSGCHSGCPVLVPCTPPGSPEPWQVKVSPFLTIIPILLTEKLRRRQEEARRPSFSHSIRG